MIAHAIGRHAATVVEEPPHKEAKYEKSSPGQSLLIVKLGKWTWCRTKLLIGYAWAKIAMEPVRFIHASCFFSSYQPDTILSESIIDNEPPIWFTLSQSHEPEPSSLNVFFVFTKAKTNFLTTRVQ